MVTHSTKKNLGFSVSLLFVSLLCVSTQSFGMDKNRIASDTESSTSDSSASPAPAPAAPAVAADGITQLQNDRIALTRERDQFNSEKTKFQQEQVQWNNSNKQAARASMMKGLGSKTLKDRKPFIAPYLKEVAKEAAHKAGEQITYNTLLNHSPVGSAVPHGTLRKVLSSVLRREISPDNVKYGTNIAIATLATQLRNAYSSGKLTRKDGREVAFWTALNIAIDTTLARYQNSLLRSRPARMIGLDHFACSNPDCPGLCEGCAENCNTAAQVEKVGGVVVLAGLLRLFFPL